MTIAEYDPTFADRIVTDRERMRFEAACAAMPALISYQMDKAITDHQVALCAVSCADALLSALYPESK